MTVESLTSLRLAFDALNLEIDSLEIAHKKAGHFNITPSFVEKIEQFAFCLKGFPKSWKELELRSRYIDKLFDEKGEIKTLIGTLKNQFPESLDVSRSITAKVCCETIFADDFNSFENSIGDLLNKTVLLKSEIQNEFRDELKQKDLQQFFEKLHDLQLLLKQGLATSKNKCAKGSNIIFLISTAEDSHEISYSTALQLFGFGNVGTRLNEVRNAAILMLEFTQENFEKGGANQANKKEQKLRKKAHNLNGKDEKILGALVLHHKLNGVSVHHKLPISNKELAEKSDEKPPAVTRFFKKAFATKLGETNGSHKSYKAMCFNKTIGQRLSLLRGDFSSDKTLGELSNQIKARTNEEKEYEK